VSQPAGVEVAEDPAPQPDRPGRRGGFLRALFLPASLAILVLAVLLVPLPVYLETPGTPVSLQDAVSIEDEAAADLAGDFLLTTVRLSPGTPARVVQGLVDAHAVLVRSALVIPPGEEEREYFDRQRQVFRAASDVAAAVALSAAGYDVDPSDISGSGVLVGRVLPGTPADGVLQPGDVITAVDGTPVRIADDLRPRIAESDDELELLVVRDEVERTERIEPADITTADGSIRGIGVEIQTADPRIELPVQVDVASGSIGGPSAGLMLALTIFDKVAEEDLARGRIVAGTGTLSPDGRVGAIGGIARKVASAERIGADVFVSPADQLEAARAAVSPGSDLQVIGAATFEEALAALRG
jgi:Lon-like protease